MTSILRKISEYSANLFRAFQFELTRSQVFVFAALLACSLVWTSSAHAFGFSFGFGFGFPAMDLNGIVLSLLLEITNIPNLISVLCYVGGVFLAALGIINLKNHVDDPNSYPLSKGLTYLAVGAGCLALPQLTEIAIRTFGLKSILFRAAILGDFPLGQEISFGPSTFDFASLVQNIASQTIYFPLLMSAFAYISGVAFLAMALHHFKRNGDQPNPDEFRKGISKFAISAGLLALPQITDIVVNTLGLGPDFIGVIWAGNIPGGTDVATEDAKTLALRSIGQIVALPQVLAILSYVIGVAFCFAGLLTLKKYSDNPGQGGVREAIGRFVVGGALLALPRIASVVMNTLGLDGMGTSFFAEDLLALYNATGDSGGEVQDTVSLITKLASQASALPLLIIVASFVAGTLFTVAGLLGLKKQFDDPSQPLRAPLGQLIIAGALFGLPILVEVVANTFDFELFANYLFVAMPENTDTASLATDAPVLIQNVALATAQIEIGVWVIAYIAGLLLIVLGLLSLKRTFENGPGQEPSRIGLGKIGVGGALLSFPSVRDILLGTFGYGNVEPGDAAAAAEQATGLRGLINVFLEQMTNLPSLIITIAGVTGVVLIFSGLLSLKRHMEDPRSETLPKSLGRFFVGTALISLDFFGGLISKTLGLATDGSVTAPDGYASGDGELDTTGQIGGVLRYLTGQLDSVEGLLFFIALLSGIFFVFMALLSFKKHVDDPSSAPIGQSVTSLLIGGAFFAFASLVPVLMAIFQLETMDQTGLTNLATAQGLGGTMGPTPLQGDNTVGASILRLQNNVVFYGGLLEIISYLMGLGLLAVALWKFKQHVDQPTQITIWEPVKHLGAAAGFLGLPAFISLIMFSLKLDGTSSISTTGFNFGEAPEGGALDDLFIRLAQDMVPSMLNILEIFAILAGLTFMMVGVYRITQSAQQGARGPLTIGTAFTFIVGAVLLATPEMMSFFSNSIFSTDSVRVNVVLSFLGEAEGNPLVERTQQVFSAITAFMVLIGFISFVRGWFLLKAFAEGNQQATLMAASSHIIAGVLAVNIGPLINAVQATLGVSGVAFN